MLKKANRIPNLTSIRFFLALLVVIFHISEFFKKRGFPYFDGLAIFHKGTEAVYIFFSLSGFLIIRQLYVEKKETNSIDLKAFYLRRILRIFPLYYLVLTFGFLYYHFILPYFGFTFANDYDLITGVLLSITFFPNIFATYGPGGILEILWSIGIEEQFYLFIAPVLLIISVKKIKLFLGAFTIFYFLLYFSESLDFLAQFNMLFFYFSISGLCSIMLENRYFKNFINKFRYLILLLFVLHITTSLFKSDNSIIYHLFNLVLFGLTISALSQKPLKILENKRLEYLGKISYGIYMFHAIVMQFVGLLYLKFISKFNFIDTIDIVLTNIIIISITIMVSHFSFKYYENYFLRKKR